MADTTDWVASQRLQHVFIRDISSERELTSHARTSVVCTVIHDVPVFECVVRITTGHLECFATRHAKRVMFALFPILKGRLEFDEAVELGVHMYARSSWRDTIVALRTRFCGCDCRSVGNKCTQRGRWCFIDRAAHVNGWRFGLALGIHLSAKGCEPFDQSSLCGTRRAFKEHWHGVR